MIKRDILKEYKNEDERMILAQILDKINFVETKNKIEYTNFLDMYQIDLVNSFFKKIKYYNYILWGGYELAERKVVILYPEKLDEKMVEKNYNKIASIIRVNLAEEEFGKYSHRNYLGAIMKLGIEREMVGDILVEKNGADIIVKNETVKFLLQELPMLTRFEKSDILEEKIEDIRSAETKTEEVKIIIPSLRLDNFVSDLARTSRNKAVEIIKNERVFINGKNETKLSKQIKVGDTITIRGKGRFVVKEYSGTTRSGRTVALIEKFV